MPGSEFQLIQAYFSDPLQPLRPDLVLGIGDDCAIVAPREQTNLAFSIDTLVSGVHFPDNTPADAIAYKALAVNLSDLAAMGAEPAWFTLSLTLPEASGQFSHEAWLHDFSQALFTLAREHNMSLIGGDTTHGPLSVTIQICGYLGKQGGLKRSGAREGDIIVLTGALGAAAIGLDIALQQNHAHYACLSHSDRQAALDALNYPQARIAAGLSLQNIAHAALDISDGLIADLGHILNASNVGAELELEKLPLANSLACLDKESAWEKALTGGDDYELCFTVAKEDWPVIAKKHPEFTAIGIIMAQKGLRLLKADGQEHIIHSGGYDHFG
ncbi:MAG: thiamine-phosphate kinase [Gammaproteobacteria bacterium]|nr:thiamine-phosphate kinase [Gammaproteobacteria bacterium]